MNFKHTKVSIIMPLFNAEKFVEAAIESVINQSYSNWELIIVNDGSTDNSLAIAKKYEGERILIFNQPNKGQCAANNFGFSKSNGQYIKFFDADDILSKFFLEEQVQVLYDTENCIASASWGRFYDNDLSTFKLNREDCWQDMTPIDWLHLSWRNAQPMMQCALWLIPRNILEKSGLWNEELTLINDFDFFTRVILSSSKIKFCEKSILYYRSGISNSLSAQKNHKAILSAFTSIKLATKNLLTVDDSQTSKSCCANIWQNFVYEFYHADKYLSNLAEQEIKLLGGSSLSFQAGGFSKIALNFFPWKIITLCKKIKKSIIS